MASSSSDTVVSTGFLNAKDAAALDVELMSSPGFSLEQLMELAGLSVAEAVYQVVPPDDSSSKKSTILIVCGPGNNGGDGLVAARHLVMFGYDCVVVYPKQSSKVSSVVTTNESKDTIFEWRK
jgi:NAD(P)H-hydrate epimerase